MRPPHQNKRLIAITIGAVALVAGAGLLMSALRDNTQFFYDPSEVMAEGFIAGSDEIRIGGLVAERSIVKGEGLKVSFDVKDFEPSLSGVLSVQFEGILPDLFREGQGVVITGSLQSNGVLIASDVLAKHDENYRPKT